MHGYVLSCWLCAKYQYGILSKPELRAVGDETRQEGRGVERMCYKISSECLPEVSPYAKVIKGQWECWPAQRDGEQPAQEAQKHRTVRPVCVWPGFVTCVTVCLKKALQWQDNAGRWEVCWCHCLCWVWWAWTSADLFLCRAALLSANGEKMSERE